MEEQPTHLRRGSAWPVWQLVDVVRRIQQGNYRMEIEDMPGELGRLTAALRDLAYSLEARSRELHELDRIMAYVNAGLLLDDVLNKVYESFREIIPFNRIGLALIEDDGQTVRARWARTDQPAVHLEVGYAAPLAGSSLQQIIETGQPRIINDLEAYSRGKPSSESTRLILEEGIRSSLTCPLIAGGAPVGFIFFSSVQPGTYRPEHAATFQKIAAQLSVIVEKGQLASALDAQRQAIERQNEELRQLNGTKNTFLGIVAHDLRNPIGNIQMAAQVLVEMEANITEEERHSLLNDIYRQAQYMLFLINDLLDVTAIEAGRLGLSLEAVDMPTFLTECLELHARLASFKDIRVVLEPVPPGTVWADARRLHQIVDNLVSNAIKFSPRGSVVIVRAGQEGGGWRVSVEDRGPGIREDERERLFQYFERLSARPTGGEHSTGLGLAITRRAVEAHGGQIGVEPSLDGGSIFWFTLPAAPQQP